MNNAPLTLAGTRARALKATLGMSLLMASGLYAITATAQPAAEPVTAPVVMADDAPSYPVAFWTENGEPKAARGEAVETAPDVATVINVKVFDLGNRQMFREITIQQGDAFSPPKGRDALIYVLEGKLEVRLGEGVKAVVNAGDAYRKVAAQDNLYTALETTVILETDAPSNLGE